MPATREVLESFAFIVVTLAGSDATPDRVVRLSLEQVVSVEDLGEFSGAANTRITMTNGDVFAVIETVAWLFGES